MAWTLRGVVLCGACWVLVACGGAAPAPAAPKATHASALPTSTSESDLAPPAPVAPNCTDGTCFHCGQGICLSGFYCDESAADGAACSWLPRCAKKASCACIRRVLGSGCHCEAHDGGVFVKCG